MKSNLKAIIIGSGVAGLATAIRLAVQGFSVTVYEKNDYPGGKISHFEINGFRFAAGPSLFTQPVNIEELFTLAGENISDYFNYKPIPISCKYFYEDGTEINAYTNPEKFAQELHDKTGENSEYVLNYLKQAEWLYQNIGSVFLNNSLYKNAYKTSVIKALSTVRWKYLFKSMNALNTSSFIKPHSVQLFNRYATYNGSSPYKAPAMLCMIPHLELNEGTFYPVGGMISIANALYKLAVKKGVQFYFNTPVQRIISHQGKAMGVVAGNQNIFANVIVSSADVYNTYNYLLKDDMHAAKLLKQERSSSAIVFLWGINKQFTQLHLHNIFFSTNYKAEFEHLFRYKKLYHDPTIYINITSKYEPENAPAGKENWFVMVNTPANTGQNWEAYKAQCKANVIKKLNRMLHTEIEPLIEAEKILDPVSIEAQTASFRGSLYGTSSNTRMAAFLRHPNYSKRVKGLYFAGGSVHPGGGIPLCLKSAMIVSNLVVNDVKHLNH